MTEPMWKKNLIKGYQNFRAGSFVQHKRLYEHIGVDGQNPDVLVIACSDSRVSPSAIFNAHPGEIFVLRNVANIVPPFDRSAGFHGTSAAIEFAVMALKVDAIMVMGHESCGGISAYLDNLEQTDGQRDGQNVEDNFFLGSWIKILDKAHQKLADANLDTNQRQMEYAGIRQSLANLMSFPFVKDAVSSGRLSLLGAYFSIIEGRLLFADDDGNFSEVPAKN